MTLSHLVILTSVLTLVLSACGKTDMRPPADGETAGDTTTTAEPALPPSSFNATVKLDPAIGGVTGNAKIEAMADGSFHVTDDNSSDHGTKYWSLSEVVPNSDYLFQIQVKKKDQAGFGSLLQIDMQAPSGNVTYECAFDVARGLLVGRKAAEAEPVDGVDDGDYWVFDCPTKAGPDVKAVYAYIFPSVGSSPTSYDSKFTGTIDVKAIGYTLKSEATQGPAEPSAGQ